MKLTADFYRQGAVTVARGLLGQVLVHRTSEGLAAGRIVETEAYTGPGDRAAHSHTGIPTPRTKVMYEPGGVAYVYFIYGMYHCFNVVAAEEGNPQAVLIRALEPVEGIALMQMRRGRENVRTLCAGPGRLCVALGIGRSENGLSLLGDTLYIEAGEAPSAENIVITPRIGVDYAEAAKDYPYRFLEKGSRFVSRK